MTNQELWKCEFSPILKEATILKSNFERSNKYLTLNFFLRSRWHHRDHPLTSRCTTESSKPKLVNSFIETRKPSASLEGSISSLALGWRIITEYVEATWWLAWALKVSSLATPSSWWFYQACSRERDSHGNCWKVRNRGFLKTLWRHRQSNVIRALTSGHRNWALKLSLSFVAARFANLGNLDEISQPNSSSWHWMFH